MSIQVRGKEQHNTYLTDKPIIWQREKEEEIDFDLTEVFSSPDDSK